MNLEEYKKLESVEHDHWFYRGKRDIVRYWVQKYHPLQNFDQFIDAGCGTGTLLVEMGRVCQVKGLDSNDESVAIARPKLASIGGTLIQTGLNEVPLASGCASVVTLLDVLEHNDDDANALDEMIRLVRPGGLILITVPALRCLWSDWDIALQHRRRYDLSRFGDLVRRPGVEVLRCTYINTVALLPIFLIRMLRQFFPPKPGRSRAEDCVPPKWLNSLLHEFFVRPACWAWFRPPAGVTLFAILRRVPAGSSIGSSRY